MSFHTEEIKVEDVATIQEEYVSTIEQIFATKYKRQNGPSVGSHMWYYKEFLSIQPHDGWWSQPQATEFCNKRVASDGGVGWNTKKGAKKHPDGSPAIYGDPGREVESFRQEYLEGCFDNQTGQAAGPFRLNIGKYNSYKGPTKCHGFSDKIKKEVLKQAKGKCELCGFKGKLEVDHFVPKEKGGESTIENANALCGRCNDRKCNKEPTKFMLEEFERMKTYFTKRSLTPPY